MKKMYLFIFLVVLIALVFAGCLSFSNGINPMIKDNTDSNLTSDISQVPDVTENNSDIYPTQENPAPVPDVTADMPDVTVEGEIAQVPANNEYEVLRHGTFYAKGSMIESNGKKTPMEIAIGDDSVYMLSDFEGKDMGVLINDQMYMIYPEGKCYLEISKTLLKLMGQSQDDLIDIDSLKVFEGDPLSAAKEIKYENLNGHNCTVYIFKTPSGKEKRVYMDGERLIRFADYNGGQFSSSYDFDFVKAQIPADKSAPPQSYQKYEGVGGVYKFMTLLEGTDAQ